MLKKIILTPLLIILILVGYVGANAFSIWYYGSQDYAKKADVIIVLGASVAYRRVSPVYRERINHGIDLLNKGYASKLVLTGGKIAGQQYSDASVARAYAISKGVSASSILIEEKSRETSENLKYAKALMDEYGYKTAIIVSDPLHMKRAMLMAKDEGIDGYSSPTPTSMYKSAKARRTFLEKEVFNYIGYKFYRIYKKIA